MAIIESLPGLQVTIESGGQPLEEYPDSSEWTQDKFKVNAASRSSVFVQCISDAEFQINAIISPDFDLTEKISLRISIDGNSARSLTFSADMIERGRFTHVYNRLETRVSPTEIIAQPLKFCGINKLDEVDKEQIKKDVETAKRLGMIVVAVHRIRVQNKVFKPATRVASHLSGTVTEISEKALKGQAISHGVGYGAETRIQRTQAQSSHSTTFVDGIANPRGVFVFKYRSRAALQAELIIPRSPSPEAEATPIIGSSQESSASSPPDQDRRSKLKDELAKIKSELKQEEENSRKRSFDKSQTPHREKLYKVKRQRDGKTVVDLTVDD